MKTYYQILFVIGLLFESIGQILLSKGNNFVYALKPIDFAHWSLLLGAVLLIPQIGNFRKSIFTFIGAPIILVGITCIIGMCVLDFIWWSQPTQEIRNQFAGHISKFPSIWKPFITTGPNFLNVGLFLLALNYFKQNKVGVLLITIATFAVFFFSFSFKLILVYLITALGYGLIFFNNKRTNEL